MPIFDLELDLYSDLRASAGIIADAREAVAAAREHRLPAFASGEAPFMVDHFNLGTLQATCEHLANKLERAHAALEKLA